MMYNFNEYFSPLFLVSLQVGNLGLLFMLLFFIFAALGVELFGDLGKFSALPELICGNKKKSFMTKSSLYFFLLHT